MVRMIHGLELASASLYGNFVEIFEVAHREWCSGADERHSIHEDSRRITDDPVLSIPWWTPRAWFCDPEF